MESCVTVLQMLETSTFWSHFSLFRQCILPDPSARSKYHKHWAYFFIAFPITLIWKYKSIHTAFMLIKLQPQCYLNDSCTWQRLGAVHIEDEWRMNLASDRSCPLKCSVQHCHEICPATFLNIFDEQKICICVHFTRRKCLFRGRKNSAPWKWF